MANILDIRRRIRSVVNTRQITKAMKTVSAAKLRRAQNALSRASYSQMAHEFLKSLVSRADIYDPRPENRVIPCSPSAGEKHPVDSCYRSKGLAGAFNTNILKMASKFIESKPDQISTSNAIGRKGRDFMRRRYPSAPESVSADGATNASAGGETGVSPVHSGTEAVPVRAARFRSQASMSES